LRRGSISTTGGCTADGVHPKKAERGKEEEGARTLACRGGWGRGVEREKFKLIDPEGIARLRSQKHGHSKGKKPRNVHNGGGGFDKCGGGSS